MRPLSEQEHKPTSGRGRGALETSLLQFVPYFLQALLIALILTIQLGLAERNLAVPFDYKADTVYESAIVKAVISDGWWWHTRYLGAPTGLNLVAVPTIGNLDGVVIKLIALFTSKTGLVLNLYWLLTILLAGVISTWCMCRLGIKRLVAFSLGILYALSPHVYYRHTAHLMLAHHVIPLVMTAALFLAMGRSDRSHGTGWRVLLAGCVLVGFSYIYWAFFSCFVLVVGGLVGFLRQRNSAVLRLTALATGLVAIATAVNLAPSIWTWEFQPTLRKFINYKMPAEAEIYGLKIRQLLAPKSDSRIPLLARIADESKAANYPLENENSMSRMGIIPSLGFLLAVGVCLLYIGEKRGPTLEALKVTGTLIIGCVLLATIGGFGSIFNLLILPDIRCYNRISIFIVFFSLVSVGIIFSRLFARFPQNNWSVIGLIIALLLGISDQNEASLINAWKIPDEKKFQTQTAFVQKIESSLPKDSMVYELPQGQYGDDARIKAVMWNSDEEPFLLSHSIRWSWPAVTDAAIDLGQVVEELDPSALAKTLYYRGYLGIYIDREGYADGAPSLISGLTGYLGRAPIQSSDGRYVFFSLSDMTGKQGRENLGRYSWGTSILFNSTGSAARYLGEGWSCLGCTDGKTSSMNLRVSPSPVDLSINAHITPSLNTTIRERPVRIFVNGMAAGEWRVRQPDWFSVSVPHSASDQRTVLAIRFELPNAVAPPGVAAQPDFHISGVHFDEMIVAPKTIKVNLASYPAVAAEAEPLPKALANSGFEDGNLFPWNSWLDPEAAVNTRFARSGTHSLAETGAGSMYQDATGLEPGYTYKVAAWVSGSPETTATGQISIWDPGTNVATSSPPVTVDRNWKMVTHTATVSASGTLRIHLFRNSGTGAILWDDVSIARVQ